jgi:hypothetical protein
MDDQHHKMGKKTKKTKQKKTAVESLGFRV